MVICRVRENWAHFSILSSRLAHRGRGSSGGIRRQGLPAYGGAGGLPASGMATKAMEPKEDSPYRKAEISSDLRLFTSDYRPVCVRFASGLRRIIGQESDAKCFLAAAVG